MDEQTTATAPGGRRTHQLRQIVLGDTARSWRAAGFEVDDDGAFALGPTTLRCVGTGPPFGGWRLDDLPSGASNLDGLASIPDGSAAASNGSHPNGSHPNGIVSIDHVVVRTGDCARTIAAFEAAGLTVRGGRSTTSYGAPMRQTFFWAGDVIVELVGPDDGEPTTDEATSIFGLALVAADLAATAAHLGPLLGTAKDAVQPGRQIAGLRGKEVGISLPIAVMSPHPRSGG